MSQPATVPASAADSTPDGTSADRPATGATSGLRVGAGDRNLSIAVIGGSLVGPAAELFLRRAGFTDVTTYEATPRAHSQSGGVMGLRLPTVALLESIGLHRDRIVALPDNAVNAYAMDGGHVTARGTSMFPGQVTSWDALYAALAQRVEVVHGHRLARLCPTDGRYGLRFANGYQREADVVLFADGRKSAGRMFLDPARRLTYNGYVVWRGLVDTPTPKPHGFNRYFDIAGGRLFSLTGPLNGTGKSYWEFSHNLPEADYTRLAGGRGPTDHAYILPQQIGPAARSVIAAAADGMPPMFQELLADATVSGIPVNDAPMPQRALWTSATSGAAGNTARGRVGGVAALLGDALLPVRLQVGAGLNSGLHHAASFAHSLAASSAAGSLDALYDWETATLDRFAPWIELGRSRAHRNNLGWYEPVRPGFTAVPASDQWSEPTWVLA
jgi:2-polyprenyl-6-methoxyphenol hydroxylase-like FAD-dependent oxidoreductase